MTKEHQPGGGFVRINRPEVPNIPPGKPAPTGDNVYDTSLFHQLHCLASIRGHLLLLKSSIGRNNSDEIQRYLLDPQVDHVYHCFDYIRQSLMCAGDMTLEWPREETDGTREAFDGWGVTHQCKDWVSEVNAFRGHTGLTCCQSAILKFMEEHNALNGLPS